MMQMLQGQEDEVARKAAREARQAAGMRLAEQGVPPRLYLAEQGAAKEAERERLDAAMDPRLRREAGVMGDAVLAGFERQAQRAAAAKARGDAAEREKAREKARVEWDQLQKSNNGPRDD